MQVLLGPVKYVNLLNAPALIPVLVPAACRVGIVKIPSDVGIQVGSVGATNPHGLLSPTLAPPGWKQKQTAALSELNSEWFG